jgi:hypothetical protein
MADRIKRYAVAEKAAQYADEIISYYAQVFRNQEDTLVRMAAGKWLWEAAFGKPAQAADATFNQQPQKIVHVVRWLPPDPNDKSKEIQHQDD